MSRAQQFRRCPFGCGVVANSHRCQQRHQSKMRGPTAGLTNTPPWDDVAWKAHTRAKVEPVAKPVEAGKALDHGGVVLVGDTWAWSTGKGKRSTLEVTGVHGGDVDLTWCDDGVAGKGDVTAITRYWKLISRASKPERVAGEFRPGDECVIKNYIATDKYDGVRVRVAKVGRGRVECDRIGPSGDGPTVFCCRAHELVLLKAVE